MEIKSFKNGKLREVLLSRLPRLSFESPVASLISAGFVWRQVGGIIFKTSRDSWYYDCIAVSGCTFAWNIQMNVLATSAHKIDTFKVWEPPHFFCPTHLKVDKSPLQCFVCLRKARGSHQMCKDAGFTQTLRVTSPHSFLMPPHFLKALFASCEVFIFTSRLPAITYACCCHLLQ